MMPGVHAKPKRGEKFAFGRGIDAGISRTRKERPAIHLELGRPGFPAIGLAA